MNKKIYLLLLILVSFFCSNVYAFDKTNENVTIFYSEKVNGNIILSNSDNYFLLMIISGLIVSFIISCFICYIKVIISSTNYDISNDDILNNCDKKFDIKKVNSYKTGEKKEYSPVDYDY